MNDNLKKLTGPVPFFKALPFSLQQVLVMFVTNTVPIFLITSLSVTSVSSETVLALVQNAMIAAGISTIIQVTPFSKIGSGLPIFMGASFTFVTALSAVSAKWGYGAVLGTVIAGGIIEGLLGLTARYWKNIISPMVSAVVVTGIGLSLLSVMARSFGGGYNTDFGSPANMIIGASTFLICLLWTIFVKGNRKNLSLLAGLSGGCLIAALFGKLHFSTVSSVRFFALPKILPLKPVFRWDAVISVAIIYLVSATETIGDVSAISAGALHRAPKQSEISGALAVDGFGSAFAGLLGTTPITSYTENTGLTIMTGVINRNVARIGGAVLILAGFFPRIGAVMRLVPDSVIGGMLLMVLGQIIVSGIKMMAEAGFTERNMLIAAISLSVGIGFTSSTEAGIWSSFAVSIQSIFSQNVVAVIFVTAVILNLVLPKKLEN